MLLYQAKLAKIASGLDFCLTRSGRISRASFLVIKMKHKPRRLAIIAIAVLVGICLVKGINSVLLASAMGLIAGLGGLEIREAKKGDNG